LKKERASVQRKEGRKLAEAANLLTSEAQGALTGRHFPPSKHYYGFVCSGYVIKKDGLCVFPSGEVSSLHALDLTILRVGSKNYMSPATFLVY